MIIPPDLFKTLTYTNEENKVLVSFEINEAHPVFEGHFPGQPVLPGVLQMAFINECLRNAVGKKLRIYKTGQMKFLSMIDPSQCKNLKATIQWKESEMGYSISASIYNEEVVFYKMNSEYIVV